MIFRQLFDADSSTYTYLVGDEASGEAALVDTVREKIERDTKLVRELGLRLVAVLDTHVHADHVTAAGELRSRTGARTYQALVGGAPCADVGLRDGDEITVGSLRVRAIATPGHTSSCMSFALADRVMTGDALLVRGCGRTDFQEGDASALWDSVTKKLFALDDATFVYPGHDYAGHTVSTIGEEKRYNPRLGGSATRESFLAIMAALKLPPPRLIATALPANLACGEVPAGVRQG